jgi:restriction endonuclease S subunit
MYMKINDLAEVLPGYTFRSAIEHHVHGNVFVFQAKDMPSDGVFNSPELLTRTSVASPEYASFLKKGDLLLLARGMKASSFRCAVYEVDQMSVIASSSVHIIRLHNQNVLSEFLCHYLNSTHGQTALSQIVSGSYIGSIPRKELKTLEVPVPPLRTQKKVIDLYKNIGAQQSILSRQKSIKQQILNAALQLATN